MTTRLIRIDLVNGSAVHDEDGRKIGRLHDARAERQGSDLVIVEYHLGPLALLARLGFSLLSVIGIRLRREPIRIPANRMDLSDPAHPRFLGKAAELRR